MKKCIFCKRTIMGKNYLGMCPRCFANLIDILIILFAVIFLPTVSNVVGFIMVILLKNFFDIVSAWVVATLVFLIFIVVFLICAGGIVFLIIRLIARNKRI